LASRLASRDRQLPLVKTAIAGSDPNWGPHSSAAGNAGVEFDPSRGNHRAPGRHGVPSGVGGLSESDLKTNSTTPTAPSISLPAAAEKATPASGPAISPRVPSESTPATAPDPVCGAGPLPPQQPLAGFPKLILRICMIPYIHDRPHRRLCPRHAPRLRHPSPARA